MQVALTNTCGVSPNGKVLSSGKPPSPRYVSSWGKTRPRATFSTGCYAHTGEEGGKTLADWLPKVKIGGVIAGDDYHEKWALVKEAVNRFIDDTGFDLMVSQTVEDNVKFSNYPSWACIKSREIDIEPDKSLEIRGKLAGA